MIICKELEASGIRKSYGKKRVLRGIDLKARAGECTGIVGANGCGKSTLLRILAGVEQADEGSLMVNGGEVREAFQIAAFTGYVPQQSALMPDLTVMDNLKLWAGFGDYRKNKERLGDLCAQFHIEGILRERAGNLSGGMCKRVNIVCALVHAPGVLLMDEPGAALDLAAKEELRGYISDFVQKGGSVLLCSHEERELSLCGCLWAIKDGVAIKVPSGLSMEKLAEDYL